MADVDPTTHYMQATERMRVRAESAEQLLQRLYDVVVTMIENDEVSDCTQDPCPLCTVMEQVQIKLLTKGQS